MRAETYCERTETMNLLQVFGADALVILLLMVVLWPVSLAMKDALECRL